MCYYIEFYYKRSPFGVEGVEKGEERPLLWIFFLNLSVAIKGKLSNHRALMYWVEVRRLPATWGLLSMALMLPQHYLYNSSLCLF
jgi:hypothetical protein